MSEKTQLFLAVEFQSVTGRKDRSYYYSANTSNYCFWQEPSMGGKVSQ